MDPRLLSFLGARMEHGVKAAETGQGTVELALSAVDWADFTVRLAGCRTAEDCAIPAEYFLSHAGIRALDSGGYEAELAYLLPPPPGETAEEESEEELPTFTVHVIAEEVEISYTLTDYSYHPHRGGLKVMPANAEAAALCLIEKKAVLGGGVLNGHEKALEELCWLALLLEGGETLDRALSADAGVTLADATGMALKAMRDFPENVKLARLLGEYARALGTNDETFQKSRRKAVAKYYRWMTLDEDAMRLYHTLFFRFIEACEGFAGSAHTPPDDEAFRRIDAYLRLNGFTGAYPHYRRLYRRAGEYVTVEAFALPRAEGEATRYGYTFKAGIGHLSGSRKKGYRLGHIPFAETVSFDCQWERTGRQPANNRYRELMTVSDPAGLDRGLDVLMDGFDGKWLPKEYGEELYGRVAFKDFFNRGMLFIYVISGLFFSVVFEVFIVAVMLLASTVAALIRMSWEPFSMMLEWGIYLKAFLFCFFGGGLAVIFGILWETRLLMGVVAIRRRRRKNLINKEN